MSLRDLAKKNPPLREGSFPEAIEHERVAMLPGDGDPEDHVVERLVPSAGAVARKMEKARRGHRIAEDEPERGAYHGGAPVPDRGGQIQEYTGSLGRTEGPNPDRPRLDRSLRGVPRRR